MKKVVSMEIKQIEKNLDQETKDLIELSREILGISRKIQNKKVIQDKPNTTAYEEAIKINPYLSKDNVISYY